jgi:hypothetical protein
MLAHIMATGEQHLPSRGRPNPSTPTSLETDSRKSQIDQEPPGVVIRYGSPACGTAAPRQTRAI